MFGYIAINRPELRVREYERYRAYYCGLCQALKKRSSRAGQLTLSFDMTFLGILLTSLYEPHTVCRKERCILHPAKEHLTASNECITYAADMNLLLAWYDLLDDWHDDRNVASLTHAKLLKPTVEKIRAEYPAQAAAVSAYVRELNACEKENSTDLDRVAGLTGKMLGSLFAWKDDEWKEQLYSVGFFMGKFIYLMDAYDDLADDVKKGRYNPWVKLAEEPDFDQKAESIMEMMMGECSFAFEKLPLIRDRELLRNVIYAGVWTKFTEKKAGAKAKEKKGRKSDV